MTTIQLSFHSDLNASSEELWNWITSIEGIGQELRPLLKMTAPTGIRRLQDIEAAPGEPLFHSWLLLFGFLPIDRSELTLQQLEPGCGFLEQSPMLSMRLWRHQRTLTPHNGRIRLTDTLTFEPRLPAFVAKWFVRTLFEHRHAVLRRTFGTSGS